MNEVLRCLCTRRSVRAYLPRQVEEETLAQILQAGMYAPSGMGRQAGKIVVLQDAQRIAELERMNAEILGNPDAHPFYGAPTVLVVLADSRREGASRLCDSEGVFGAGGARMNERSFQKQTFLQGTAILALGSVLV